MREASTPRPVPDALRVLLLAALCLACALPVFPAESERARPRYEAEIEWSPDTGAFDVIQTIHWTNRSSRALSELRLLHPWAALAATEGPWWRSARELGHKLPRERDAPDVSVIALKGQGEDWIARLDDAHEMGSGAYALALREPLAPGQELALRIETRSRLETIVGRVGRHRDFLAAAGWLVRVAPFDAARHERGEHPWSDESAHALVETQIEHFDARWSATLPARYAGKLAATGTLVEERVEGDRVHARWDAPGVVELALFADPRFIVRDARDVHYMRVRGGPQPRVYLQPEHHDLAELMLSESFWQAQELADLGGRSIARVAVVDPPLGARGVSGMEYPGVVTVRPRPTRQGLSIETLRLLRHELAHQVFYAEIASDTVNETFLEEGLATLWEMLEPKDQRFLGAWSRRLETEFLPDPGMERRSVASRLVRANYLGAGPGSRMRKAVEAAPLSWMALDIDEIGFQRLRWVSRAGREKVRCGGADYRSRQDLMAHAYALSALTIAQALQEHELDPRNVLRGFVDRQRGQHVSADDFLEFLDAFEESGAGRTLAQYWDTVGFVDAAIAEIGCDDEAESPRCEVLFEHRGPWRPPLEVWLSYEDQRGVETQTWPKGQAQLRVKARAGRRLEAAGVRVVPLDTDYSNNWRLIERNQAHRQRFWWIAWRQLVLRLSGLGRLP